VNGADVTLTPEDQWEMLDAFIESDKYLKTRRGKYAERNGARMPFQHQFDLRILQDFAIKAGSTTNRLQLSLDIINVGNLINSDWGMLCATITRLPEMPTSIIQHAFLLSPTRA
jgi:hypothetical protein